LRAAFDHRHVFLDPDPDPETSFAERERLFALPRSSWADYRPDLLSKGGAVIARGTKTIRLSPEARALLGIAAETVDSDQLIQAVLRMPTDLLFNGGIGTYVKAQSETNADVGDSANAAVRVSAGELRAPSSARGAISASRSGHASSSRSPAPV
jgi:glutamate dehydrogenase